MSEQTGMDVSGLRRSADDRQLEREDLHDDPIVQFERWFGEACERVALEPNAFALATADAEGRPSSRTVLLKYFDTAGFVFFTNYSSRKSQQLAANPRVSMLFFWRELGRQLAIDGGAGRIPASETLRYFATRPRGSQVGAWVSAQSSVVSSRALLESKFEEMKRKFGDGEVPLPSFWGGYRVVPRRFEFWQGRANRLHDRFQYLPDEAGGWRIDRLAP